MPRRGSRYDLSVGALHDQRVRVVEGDVSTMLSANPGAFDAIMLDTDNGPDGMFMSENGRLNARQRLNVGAHRVRVHETAGPMHTPYVAQRRR